MQECWCHEQAFPTLEFFLIRVSVPLKPRASTSLVKMDRRTLHDVRVTGFAVRVSLRSDVTVEDDQLMFGLRKGGIGDEMAIGR